MLESARKQTRPRTVDLYDKFCAVLYLLRTGCQWRDLPTDFPKWRTVHTYFMIWSEIDDDGKSLLERALKNQIGAAREKLERSASTSFLIVDAQSVKNSDTAENKGYDATKKASGIKCRIAVDTQGFPHAIAVTTAEVTDRDGAVKMLELCAGDLQTVKNVLADGGYTGEPFTDEVLGTLGATVQIAKRN